MLTSSSHSQRGNYLNGRDESLITLLTDFHNAHVYTEPKDHGSESDFALADIYASEKIRRQGRGVIQVRHGRRPGSPNYLSRTRGSQPAESDADTGCHGGLLPWRRGTCSILPFFSRQHATWSGEQIDMIFERGNRETQ